MLLGKINMSVLYLEIVKNKKVWKISIPFLFFHYLCIKKRRISALFKKYVGCIIKIYILLKI
ncbi:hypothetical protein COF37_22975 [Bacillus wiedmannii]|nr:hypothetical protein COF37_22975 [Bacillus wiedmannii]